MVDTVVSVGIQLPGVRVAQFGCGNDGSAEEELESVMLELDSGLDEELELELELSGFEDELDSGVDEEVLESGFDEELELLLVITGVLLLCGT